MSNKLINDNALQVLLPEYYKRLFPHYLLCKWLGYSEGNTFLGNSFNLNLLFLRHKMIT